MTVTADLPVTDIESATGEVLPLAAEEELAQSTAAAPARKSRRELAAEVEMLRAEVARLRAGEEPVGPHDPMTTGGHLLWVLGHANAEMRERLAGVLVRSMTAATLCAELNHTETVLFLRNKTEKLETAHRHAQDEAARLDRTSGPEGRAVAMAITYALLPGAH